MVNSILIKNKISVLLFPSGPKAYSIKKRTLSAKTTKNVIIRLSNVRCLLLKGWGYFIDQADIIHGLLIWLEGHLDHPLLLDNVAAKAGYSKWHLQRMFKNVTGHAIGVYIRAHRLSKSAVVLRLTACPILDVTLQYHFDSQQTSTRAFKKQFARTSTLYRHSPEWSVFDIHPPLCLGKFTMPRHKFVTLENTPLIGATQSYSYSLEQISDLRHEIRYQFQHDFLGSSPTIPPVLCGLNETRPNQDKDDEQEVFYIIALAQDQADGCVLTRHPVMLQGGEHVMFTYEGLGTGVQESILTAYGTCIPTLNLTRRKGRGVERYYPAENVKVGDRPINLRRELLIPIRRQRRSSSNAGASRCEMSPMASTTQLDASRKLS